MIHYTSGPFVYTSANCAGTIYIYIGSLRIIIIVRQKSVTMYIQFGVQSLHPHRIISRPTQHIITTNLLYVVSDIAIAYILLLFYTNTVTATVIFPLI